MKLDFFDVNVWIGGLMNDNLGISITVEELIKKMSSLNIKKAIAYHIYQRDAHPDFGNKVLVDEIFDKPFLYGLLTLLPFQTAEVERLEFSKLKSQRIVGFILFPKRHNYILDRITFGNFLSELEYRRFPVFFDLYSGFSVDYEGIYNILKDFPNLVCILCNLGIWNTDRYTWPLLDRFQNVYLESSFLSLYEGGLEETVKRFGGERILFGSGYPERYIEASMLQLIHSDISEEDKEKIAYKNIERIIGEIRYE